MISAADIRAIVSYLPVAAVARLAWRAASDDRDAAVVLDAETGAVRVLTWQPGSVPEVPERAMVLAYAPAHRVPDLARALGRGLELPPSGEVLEEEMVRASVDAFADGAGYARGRGEDRGGPRRVGGVMAGREEADRMSAVEEHLIDAGAERGTVRLRGLGRELGRRGLGPAEVARRARLARHTVAAAAAGKQRTQIRVAREIARVVGVPLEDLCAPPLEPYRAAGTLGEDDEKGAA